MKKKYYLIKIFIPTRYEGRVDVNDISNNHGDIPSGRGNGFYRFYGIYIDENKRIGYAKYHIFPNSISVDLESIEIDPNYRGCGYGKILLENSIRDLKVDFDCIKNINVLSVPDAIGFYRKSGFVHDWGEYYFVKRLK